MSLSLPKEFENYTKGVPKRYLIKINIWPVEIKLATTDSTPHQKRRNPNQQTKPKQATEPKQLFIVFPKTQKSCKMFFPPANHQILSIPYTTTAEKSSSPYAKYTRTLQQALSYPGKGENNLNTSYWYKSTLMCHI